VLLGGLDARAADGEALHVWLTGSAIEEAASKSPMALPANMTGGTFLQLRALTYCGPASDKEGGEKNRGSAGSVGRFLAFVEQQGSRNGRVTLDATDCGAGIAATSARLAGAASDLEGAVAEVRANTRGGLLKAWVHDVALVRSGASGRGGASGGGGAPAAGGASQVGGLPVATDSLEAFVSSLRAGGDAARKGGAGASLLVDVPLKDIPIELSPGRKISVNLQAGFVGDGMDVVLGLADKRATGGPGSEMVRRPDMPSAANARFALGWELAAEVLRRMESTGPFVVETQQETFEVSHLSLSGNGAGAKARGKVRARSLREDFQLAIGFDELDLKVGEVSVEPNLADCRALGFLQRVSCSSQNAARSAAATAAANALANRYQGRLVSQLLGSQNLRFELQGTQFNLHVDPVSFTSAAFGLLGSAAVKLELFR